MKKLLMILLLFAAPVQPQVTTTTVNKTMPVGGYVISIPRQKVVCYSQAGKLLIAWPGDAYSYYQTTDAGTSWAQTNLSSASYRAGILMGHLHMSIWNDTVYTARGYTDSTFIVDKIAPNNVLVANTQVTVAGGVGSSGRIIMPTIAPTGHNNDLVAVIRNENNSILPYWFTSLNGTSWMNRGTTGLLPFDANARHGLISNPPESTFYLEYLGSNVSVFYFNTQTTSWNRHGSSAFTLNGTQRVFSGVISGGVTFVAHQEGYVGVNTREAYSVFRATAYGSGARSIDTLWYTTAHTFDSNQPGQVCMQEIKSIPAVIVYYLKTDSTYANTAARQAHLHLYAKVWYNNAWSSEQTIDGTHYYANISAPFQVPSNHGAIGYVLGNTPSHAAGYLSVVTINTGESLPSTPTLSSPSDGAMNQSTSLTLLWYASIGATSYHLQVSNSSGFGTTVYDQAGLSGTSQVINGLNNTATYYWHVSASNGGGTSGYSAAWSFTTLMAAPPVAPILASPANGASGIPVNSTLTWNASSNAISYRVQVSTDAAFGAMVVDQSNITVTSLAVTGLSTNTTYYWHVSASNGGGTSGYSAAWSFTTLMAAPPVAPILASPANGASGIPVNSTLTWNASSNATSYRVQASTDPVFGTTIIDQSNITVTSLAVTGLSANTTYYWHVSASNGGGTSGYSAAWSFTTLMAAPPVAPILASPANGASGIPVNSTLTWNASSNATSYGVQASTDPVFGTTIIDQNNITVTSLAMTGLSTNTTYYWHVSASNGDGTSGYSAAWSFTTMVIGQVTLTPTQKNLPSVGQGVYIGIPRQQAVCLSANNTLLTRWGSVSSPRMWRTTNAGDTWAEMSGTLPTSMAHDHLAVWNDTTYNFAGVQSNRFDELIVNPEGYRNTVINQTVANLGSDQVIFSGQPANFGNDMVGLARNGTQGMFWYLSHDRGRTWIDKGRDGIFPNQYGVTGRMGISWNPPDTPMAVVYTAGVVNIYYYEPHDTTWVRHGTNQFNTSSLPDRFYSGIIVNGYTYVAGLVSGGYRVWRAQAHTNDVPVEFTLYTGAVPTNPYIALQEIKSFNGVMAYYLHGDGSLWGRLYYNGTWSTESLLSGAAYTNMVAPFQVPVSHGNQGYLFGNTAAGNGYLVVVAIGGVGDYGPLAPTLSTPLDGATDQLTSPTLLWNASIGAASYRLQASSSSGFGTTVYDQSGLLGTSQAISGLDNAATYYWHVSASNGGGTSGYSSTSDFTTLVNTPEAPTLAYPLNGASGINNNPILTWNTSSNATSYRVQASTDPLFGTTIIDQSNIAETSLAVTGLSANTTYYWHVSASNGDGTSGYSAAWSFTTMVPTPPVAPILASPATGAAGISTNPTLTWHLSANATSYRVRASTDPLFGTTIIDQSNIAETSLAVTGLSANTTYYWHVSASNGGGTSGYSAAWSFTTMVPTPPVAPILASPATGAAGISTNPTLTWHLSANATSYRVQASTDPLFGTTIIEQSNIAETSLAVTGLSANTTYYWHVSASNGDGTSGYSAAWSFTTMVIGQVTLTPTQKNLPSVGQGVYIGIPRQQAVCLSANNTLLTRWGSVSSPRMWRTTNSGDTWAEMSGALPSSMAHDHLAVWNDTTYNFAGVRYNRFDELIANPNGSRNTVINQTVANLGSDQVIFSGQPANFGNDMVGLARNGTQGMFWYLSHDRGRTWIDKGRGPFPNQAGLNGRMGIIWNYPDTAMALTYAQGAINVFYYQPHDTSWVRHGTSRFNISDVPDRFFSGVICGGYTFVAGWVRNGYSAWKARAHTNDLTVETPLYSGTTPTNPYIALQEIKSINGVMAYYLHGNGSLWGRLYYNGSWSTETLLSSVSFSNMTAPFQVPTSHGARGYLFGNNSAGNGYLIVIDISGVLPAMALIGDPDENNSTPMFQPEKSSLTQNYPNPFNAQTTIEYNLTEESAVVIDIYNFLGQKIETLVDEEQQVGSHRVIWNAGKVSSGIYFYRIQAGNNVETHKMVMIK